MHDGTTQPQLDVSQGLISALGGQVLHPLEFEGAEITPTQSGSGIVLDEPNETNPTSGMTTWLSHPSNLGYTRQSSGGNTIGGSGGSANAIAPTQDSGTSNGSSQDELERLLNFNGGAVQNPTSTQAAPISRAQQVAGGGAGSTLLGAGGVGGQSPFVTTPCIPGVNVPADGPGFQDLLFRPGQQSTVGPNFVLCSDDPQTNRQFLNSQGMSDKEIDELLNQGSTEEEIIENGFRNNGIVFRRPVAEAAPPTKPADPYPGLTQAADVLTAIGLGSWLAGKKAVLGDWTDEPNPLGIWPQVAVGLAGADTAADVRDLAAAANEVRKAPNN